MKIVISYELRVTGYKLRAIVLTLFFSYALTVLTAQTLNYAYHPYECAQEELFINSPSFRERHENHDCETARALTNRFYNAETKGNNDEKWNILKSVSFSPCAESYHFLETIINNSNSETDRCNALINLAWMRNPDKLPSILEYSRKLTLSVREKAAVATALTIYGIRDSLPHLVAQSVTILDEIGYNCPEDILEHCILSYWMIGGNAAINFFSSHLEKEEYRLYAALFLAQLGEHKKTFPIFKAALSSDDEYKVHTAAMGLAAISTEEAIELLINLPTNKNRCALKVARFNFDFNNFNERR
jgi:tetratricopeptide (TPR) repeat protein